MAPPCVPREQVSAYLSANWYLFSILKTWHHRVFLTLDSDTEWLHWLVVGIDQTVTALLLQIILTNCPHKLGTSHPQARHLPHTQPVPEEEGVRTTRTLCPAARNIDPQRDVVLVRTAEAKRPGPHTKRDLVIKQRSYEGFIVRMAKERVVKGIFQIRLGRLIISRDLHNAPHAQQNQINRYSGPCRAAAGAAAAAGVAPTPAPALLPAPTITGTSNLTLEKGNAALPKPYDGSKYIRTCEASQSLSSRAGMCHKCLCTPGILHGVE